jgi:hypothetical protein
VTSVASVTPNAPAEQSAQRIEPIHFVAAATC